MMLADRVKMASGGLNKEYEPFLLVGYSVSGSTIIRYNYDGTKKWETTVTDMWASIIPTPYGFFYAIGGLTSKTLYKFDNKTGALISSIGISTVDGSTFSITGAKGVACIDPDGNLYIAGKRGGYGTIVKFSQAGTVLSYGTFTGETTRISYLSWYNGKLYATGYSGKIYKLNADYTIAQQWTAGAYSRVVFANGKAFYSKNTTIYVSGIDTFTTQLVAPLNPGQTVTDFDATKDGYVVITGSDRVCAFYSGSGLWDAHYGGTSDYAFSVSIDNAKAIFSGWNYNALIRLEINEGASVWEKDVTAEGDPTFVQVALPPYGACPEFWT